MADKDTAVNSATESQAADYAFWDAPDASARVIYSLHLFHEIDFVVNEGYRKIPHGGIEVGGLLFGTVDAKTVRIEAFRPIDCEHASGPALQLSERDLTELQAQIDAAAADAELSRFTPIGWFLAHTRGPLELTDAEAKQFDRFFPAPARLTVLVKPERFQPTRFGFLIRKEDGVMPREATSLAVILPLPGRSHKPGQLIASIPAPVSSAAARRPSSTPVAAPPAARARRKPGLDEPDEVRPEKPPAAPPISSIWKIPPVEELVPERAEPAAPQPEPEPPIVDSRSPEERAARRQLGRDRARVIEQAFGAAAAPVRPVALPSLPVSAVLPRYMPSGAGQPGVAQPDALQPAYMRAQEEPAWRALLAPRALTALSLAAILGCLAGYVGYLQLPAPIIALDVRPANQTIVVSWPQEQTRNAIYAAIRFNDGAPVPLSAEEKMAGQVALAAAKDFKVEVIARNWIRDSRGIVRYLHPEAAAGQAPAELPSNHR